MIFIGRHKLATFTFCQLYVVNCQTSHDLEVEIFFFTPVFYRIFLSLVCHESAFFYEDIGIHSVTYTVIIVVAVVKAVHYMYFSKANTRTTLRTPFSPPTADKRAVEVSFIYVGCLVAVTYQVAVAVVAASATTTFFGFYKVAEMSPTDTNIVRAFHNVEIAVDAILYVTVVHPYVLCTNQTDIIAIVGIDIVGTRPSSVKLRMMTFSLPFNKNIPASSLRLVLLMLAPAKPIMDLLDPTESILLRVICPFTYMVAGLVPLTASFSCSAVLTTTLF